MVEGICNTHRVHFVQVHQAGLAMQTKQAAASYGCSINYPWPHQLLRPWLEQFPPQFPCS